MNLLDVLFSREIQRRTGAHAISIYIDNENNKKRTRTRGKKTIKASKQTKITTKKAKASLFRRLDIRFPWLKLLVACIIGIIAILDLLDLTISKAGYSAPKLAVAPFSRHVRISEREFEGKKLAALTFDDGPSSETTPKLLDILYEKDVPSTFFMLGSMARNNPDIVKRIKKEGHDVASHTMYHQNLIRISRSSAESDIKEARSIITDLSGKPPKFTRPPYGNTNDAISKMMGTPIILWSVDTEDWKSKNKDSIVDTAMSQIHDGAIILMHDIYPSTVEAVPELIKKAREAGYEFVTISELSEKRGESLSDGTSYYNFRP